MITFKGTKLLKWKVIFWLLAGLTSSDFFSVPTSDSVDLLGVLGLVASAVMLVPFFGYAYNAIIGAKKIWQVAFCIAMPILACQFVVEISFMSDLFVANPSGPAVFGAVFGGLAYLLLLLPAYRYAFKSNEFWLQAEKTES